MNFSGYAENLPGTVLDQLYQSLYVCQAILHSLPPLAKQYVVRMLHAHAIPAGEQFGAWRAVCRWHQFRAYPVHADWVDQWGSPHSVAKHKAAVDKLTQYNSSSILALNGPPGWIQEALCLILL